MIQINIFLLTSSHGNNTAMRKMRFRAANKKLKGVTTFLSGVCLYMWIFGTRAYIVVCRDLVKQGD
jgi:hypothetical protein